ncbi:Z1 domain-containing protein [Saccharospirillum alexandrii]|uniref:Z1 domain-containing protein n=1 Tax=Saccharospirillum alexandrii TaxID=2448477 RepID=UPI003735DF03
MKQTIFDRLISQVSAKLRIMEEFGSAISNGLISEIINEIAIEYNSIPNFEMTEEDVARLKFHIGNMFNVKVGEEAITLHNPELPRWFDSKKTEIEWKHWRAYRSMLESQGRSTAIVEANEKVIDDILDYSGDPSTPGMWSRKGLVMGNVQSGKTQNYIGLINKAIDCGYKTIVLLGGHLNDLRKQTQERVDEGVLGRHSIHLTRAYRVKPSPIGVGLFEEININTGTTTAGDFNKNFADSLGFKLTGEDPVIFTIKKHTGVMERLFNWIKDYHFLEPDLGKRLEGPLLLIDDEADYASINTKHHKEEVTKTNEYIRQLLSLFSRNTYVGYTATPFANIFIDPDENSYTEKMDLFPSDFMIKIPVPDNYLGQDYFFRDLDNRESEEESPYKTRNSPTIPIDDHSSVYELKKTDEILSIPDSLKDAVRAFMLVTAIRSLRGERFSHNTMLVNISHLKSHQNQLEFLIGEYKVEIVEALESYSALNYDQARKSNIIRELEKTFEHRFDIEEQYQDIFKKLLESASKIKVWAINQSNKKSDGKELNYSVHKEHGLSAIIIGGHKLSRGLTLEGLSISYFARNSKAYDTLMQMCRWFGYRPNYADLCRVYLPQESIYWYSFISSAIRELYHELELMSRREQRPSEFGLKVREHPGAMIITAKNKMGASESEVRSQDLWGQIQRRFRFRPDPKINEKNLNYTKRFITRIIEDSGSETKFEKDHETGSIVISGVSYDQIVQYIEDIDLPEDDLGNGALINHLKKMKALGLGKPRISLFNQKKTRMTPWELKLSEEERGFINESYVFNSSISLTLPKRKMEKRNNEYKVKSVNLGNSDDEKIFLDSTEREKIAGLLNRKPVSFDYLCSDTRDYPGLTIYLFAVAVSPMVDNSDDSIVELGHGRMPTVGYTVSIPRSENLKGKTNKEISEIVKQTKHSYQVNKIHSQLQEISSYEDYSDEE